MRRLLHFWTICGTLIPAAADAAIIIKIIIIIRMIIIEAFSHIVAPAAVNGC
jgi:hypothetical protein